MPEDKKTLSGGTGCLLIILILIIIGIINAILDDPKKMDSRVRDDPSTLSDDEYNNTPYDELSEMEKKQAVERAADEVADDLEKKGIIIDGRNSDKK